jgi:formylglycine-generating enzyme required for sulfatase activity
MTKQQDSIVWFDHCQSWAGTDRAEIPEDGEGVIRKARLRRFGIDANAVTVERFARFVAETDYITDAETIGWSFVFSGLLERPQSAEVIGDVTKTSWWWGMTGADWRFPSGRREAGSLPNHPVTQISWNDAQAFARWADGRLPTEVEWEHAARGGLAARRYPWGEAEPDDKSVYCNIWQGSFPTRNTCLDGHYGTAPVDAFDPNPVGLFNMAGNVWEWTADRYKVHSLKSAAKTRNALASKSNERVLKGGSFLCHAGYCWRYRIAARSGKPIDTGASHTGMRLAYDPQS